MKAPYPLPGHRRRELAVEASCHPTTFQNALKGLPVMPLPLSRIVATLTRHGLLHLLPEQPGSAADTNAENASFTADH